MEVQLNTLFVVSQGVSLKRDHLTIKVAVDRATKMTVPIHQLESVAVFGSAHITSEVLHLCAEHGVAVSFLTEWGRMQSRIDAPQSGNVLLRRTQYRWADESEKVAGIARAIVAGKVQNSRNLVMRAARESSSDEDREALRRAAQHMAGSIESLPSVTTVETVRGKEGDAARVYFEVFPSMIRANRTELGMSGRSRRPPLDPVNALLSFVYALLLHDCTAALTVAGLDPSVGYLHVDRPGRPGLALDLMEEFRPLIADRLVLTLLNRRQLEPDDFTHQEGGAVQMTDSARKTVLSTYQQRKREEVTHPLLDQKTPIGRLVFLQAKILARHLRGDLESYVPCVLKN